MLAPDGPVEELLCRYRRYLEGERGLVPAAAGGYVDKVPPFREGRLAPDGLGLELECLSAADVMAFVVACCPQQGRRAAKLSVTALRSLIGFLYVEGAISWPLAAAVPTVAGWRLAGLPKGLQPAEIGCLLASSRSPVSASRSLA